ncbi:glycoside hydrolase family 114 protein [Piromyces sp. E2]|nr:glycoside hydrolase family 114 protein [Piromyces sp. E2]|eukprot:OUM68720.1 glycoside hydrolase family 114 protein [Piromyces sp. E2]
MTSSSLIFILGTTWNWILNNENNHIKSNVEVLDIDLFDNTKKTIDSLKKQGHHIICYFSVGTFEDWRPDADKFLEVKSLVRDKMKEWDENYLDISNPQLKPIMSERFKLAQQKGCDAVEADNIDIYSHDIVKNWEKPISIDDQINYDIWLTEEAHSRGLSIAMKNDVKNIEKLLNYFDFAINEECYDYDECGYYFDTFIKENRAVFTAAYGDKCDKNFLKKLEKNTKGKKLSIIIKNKNMELDQNYVRFDPEKYSYDDICNGNNNTIDNNNNKDENDNEDEVEEKGEIDKSFKYDESDEGNMESSAIKSIHYL